MVPCDYKVNVFRLTDGRVVQGVIQEETPQVVVHGANGQRWSPAIRRDRSPQGVATLDDARRAVERLSPEEIRDLIAYLASPEQIPLP